VTDRDRHVHALPNGYQIHWYEIDGILGQGGFGITYLAHDVNLNQRVAIKEYLPTDLAVRTDEFRVEPVSEEHDADYQWGRARFIREAQTLARFKHANIVAVNAVFQKNNSAYLVMEYVEGEVLEDAIRARKIKSEERLLEIVHSLLDGLELIHEAGYIHLDIKPDNIYLRDDGSPVLLDFGSARQAFGDKNATMTALVSPGYAPHEQYDSSVELDKQGPWTDIYALAASFYRAVTGRGPIEAIVRMRSILEGKDRLRPAAEIGRGWYSERFLKAIDAALSFRTSDRPQSVSAWRDLLPPRPGSSEADESGFDLLLIADEEKPEPGEEETLVLQAPLVQSPPASEPAEEASAAPNEQDDDPSPEVDPDEETVILAVPLVDTPKDAEQPPPNDPSEAETLRFDFSLDDAESLEQLETPAGFIDQAAPDQDDVETVVGLQVDGVAEQTPARANRTAEPKGPGRLPQILGIASVTIILAGALWWYTQKHQISRVPPQQLTEEQRAALSAQRNAVKQRLEEQEAARLAEVQRQKDSETARSAHMWKKWFPVSKSTPN